MLLVVKAVDLYFLCGVDVFSGSSRILQVLALNQKSLFSLF